MINGGPTYAPTMENFISESTAPTVALMTENLLKIYDLSQAEYVEEYRNARILPNENVSRFAQRYKSLFMKAYLVSELSLGEKRLLVEGFLDALPPSDAKLLRIIAEPSELLDIDKIAQRASRTVRRTVPTDVSVNAIRIPSDDAHHTQTVSSFRAYKKLWIERKQSS